jgi:hypothetical protein
MGVSLVRRTAVISVWIPKTQLTVGGLTLV